MPRSRRLWTLAIVLTVLFALWQRWSGPTYPTRFGEDLAGVRVSGKLLRTHSTTAPLLVTVNVEGAAVDGTLTGAVVWRRYGSEDPWARLPMTRHEDRLVAEIPAQPAAGKVEYGVELQRGGAVLTLPKGETVVARFKDDVTLWVLLLHILVIFGAMLWSTRAGLEAVVGGPDLSRFVPPTLVLLAFGGLILGPVIQHQAFGAYWTGWPVGEDLTDNKLAMAVLSWGVALWRVRRGGSGLAGGRLWALVAWAVTLTVFAIPHSMHGSTLDYETMETISG